MTLIIVMGDGGSGYADFNDRGMFIGTKDLFFDNYGGNGCGVSDEGYMRSVAVDEDCWIKFYEVPKDEVEAFYIGYGTMPEPMVAAMEKVLV